MKGEKLLQAHDGRVVLPAGSATQRSRHV